jgi:hypothetical protein
VSELVDELLFQIKALQLPEPVLEHRFWPGRKFAFDLSWPECKVAAEADGATWTGGRHTSGAGFERDCIKLNHATELGWRVYRFTSGMINDGTAVAVLERALSEKVGNGSGQWNIERIKES